MMSRRFCEFFSKLPLWKSMSPPAEKVTLTYTEFQCQLASEFKTGYKAGYSKCWYNNAYRWFDRLFDRSTRIGFILDNKKDA